MNYQDTKNILKKLGTKLFLLFGNLGMTFLINSLDILTAIAATIAAVFWFKSTRIETPINFKIDVVTGNGIGGFMPPMFDGAYVGAGKSRDLTILALALKKQSKLNAIAAIFAASSTLIQAISIMVKLMI